MRVAAVPECNFFIESASISGRRAVSGDKDLNTNILTVAQMLEVQARLQPRALGVRDLERSLSFEDWDRRANRLSNALIGLGLNKGDRVAVLAYNCIEWAEIYMATAKAGIVAVPLNFRLSSPEIAHILYDAGAKAVIAQHSLVGLIDEIRETQSVAGVALISFGQQASSDGWLSYEELMASAQDTPPSVIVLASDAWALMYTSGTTGNPKGVIRDHRGMVMLSLVTEIELSITRNDDALLIMPMCHANSLNFFCAYTYCGATVTIYSRRTFDPGHALETMSAGGSTFTSLVPTQYIMLLSLSTKERERMNLESMKKLMISSAPARADTKRSIMEMFPRSGLYELYGSSEAGWVTMLHPDEQFTHLGTVGRECVASGPIKLIGADGNEVEDGQPGELFSATPYAFIGYWNNPEKTRQAFRGGSCSVGDIAVRDEDGFIRLVDRKENMIISGGENVYPTEVELVIASFPKVQEVVVIGMPDDKWGEVVHAAVVLKDGQTATEQEVVDWCADRIAAYKRPRSLSFVQAEAIPRTATGKVRHRELKSTIAAQKAN